MNNQKYDIVLLDADETVFDFKKSEAYSFEKTLGEFGVEFNEERLKLYSDINLYMWKSLERGDVTRESLKTKRFDMFFEQVGVADIDTKLFNERYIYYLSTCNFLLDGAYEFVEKLSKYCKLYLATNGLTVAQRGRLQRSRIKPLLSGCFISEEIGFSKPEKEYFEYIFSDLRVEDKKRVIFLGDSETSDMQGGKNGGIKTCLYNPNNNEYNKDLCDYSIGSYDEFFDILFGK